MWNGKKNCMFGGIMLRRSILSKLKNIQSDNKRATSIQVSANTKLSVSSKVITNLQNIKDTIGNPEDLNLRNIKIGKMNTNCGIAYISGITDEIRINNNIIKNLQQNLKDIDVDLIENIKLEVISITSIEESENMDKIIDYILDGQTVFFIDGEKKALIIGSTGGKERSVEQPQSETLIHGPRDGFIENLEVNLSLIRKDIRDPKLRFKSFEIGSRSKQKVMLCYIEDIINPNILEEVTRRLQSIDTEYVTDSAQIEQWIEDSSLSPFPQMISSERPDKASFEMLHGKFVILVDGTPFSIIGPIVLNDIVKSMEDYNQRWITASLIRSLRFIACIIALFLPAIYIALVSFHPGMLPTSLVFSIAASREGMPFNAAVEVLLMAMVFEMLQEAAIRLPRVIGQTISIVGGLVIGESAVNAGIASPIIVIVTALTAIASFCVPYYSVAISFRAIRFGVMLASALLGLYGLILSLIVMVIHITNLKSFGVPYSIPLMPMVKRDLSDTIIRAPITVLSKRENFLQNNLHQSKKGRKS